MTGFARMLGQDKREIVSGHTLNFRKNGMDEFAVPKTGIEKFENLFDKLQINSSLFVFL